MNAAKNAFVLDILHMYNAYGIHYIYVMYNTYGIHCTCYFTSDETGKNIWTFWNWMTVSFNFK